MYCNELVDCPRRKLFVCRGFLLGRCSFVEEAATIAKPPLKRPAPPIPPIARPMINAVDVGATAQIREPTSKTTTNMKKTV